MAKLPNADRAIVPERKITAYLLCHTHPNGGPKAVFFERFGFRSTEWERLMPCSSTLATTRSIGAFRPGSAQCTKSPGRSHRPMAAIPRFW